MKDIKAIRGQLRQITKDLLPEILVTETMAAVSIKLHTQMSARLDAIEEHIKSVLLSLEQRTKDTQSYLIRHVTTPQVPAPREVDSSLLAAKSEGQANE